MTSPRHTLDQLAVLEAIVEHGSFAGAARALHRVPSAVSYAVRGLEEALGVSLFDRAGHRAVLTPEGERVLAEARDVLSRARELERVGSRLQQGWEPELRVVVDGALPSAPTLAALGAFLARGAPTRVQLQVEFLDGVWDRFDALRAHIALPLEGVEARVERHRPLPELPFVLLAAPGHPLAGRALERAELGSSVELVVRDSSSAYDQEPRASWFGSRHVVHLPDFHAKRLALRQGAGYGWMPRHLVEEDLHGGDLVELQLGADGRWTYRPALVRRQEATGPAAGEFAELLLAAHHSDRLNDSVQNERCS